MTGSAPPPLPPKGSRKPPTEDTGAQHSRTSSRSSDRVREKTFSGDSDVTHVVRVTILGLAGITVDKSKCRTTFTKGKTKDLPAPPSKMKAVVAFSRSSTIHGTTTLSKGLAQSPSEAIVVSTGQEEGVETPEHRHSRRGEDDTATQSSQSSRSSEGSRPLRHIAVWASDCAMGSTVSFEASLHRSDKNVGVEQSRASSPFVPKSFELTVALTEDDNESNKIALPCGVTSLAIAGDECKGGKAVSLDLPVLNLAQARPLASNKNGLGGFPMIGLAPMSSDPGPAGQEPGKKKKSNGLQRLFKKNGSEKLPSISERKAFLSAYSMDPTGDAVLRVALEVYEKGSDLEQILLERRQRSFSSRSLSPSVSSSRSPKSIQVSSVVAPPPVKEIIASDSFSTTSGTLDTTSGTLDTPVTRNTKRVQQRIPSPCEEATSVDECTSGTDGVTAQSYSTNGDTCNTGTADVTLDSTLGETSDASSEDRTSDDDSIVTTEDNNMAFFEYSDAVEKEKEVADLESEKTDDYTLSFTKKEKPEKVPQEEEAPQVQRISLERDDHGHIAAIAVMGKRLPLPACGALSQIQDDEDTLTLQTTRGGSGTIGESTLDERTHITAEVFGRSFKFPTIEGLIRSDETAPSEKTDSRDPRISRLFDSLCRVRQRSANFGTGFAGTFSTFSDNEKSKDELSRSMASFGPTIDADNEEYNHDCDDDANDEEREAAPVSPDPKSNEKGAVVAGPEKSPTHVTNFPKPTGLVGEQEEDSAEKNVNEETKIPAKERASVSRAFTQLFACRTSGGAGGYQIPAELDKEEVPPVIIPAESQDMSLGDLTATTHELQLAAESSDRKDYRREAQNRLAANLQVPMPVAFGGEGLCALNTSSSPIDFMSSRESSGITDHRRDSDEDYFAEYDDHRSLLQR